VLATTPEEGGRIPREKRKNNRGITHTDLVTQRHVPRIIILFQGHKIKSVYLQG
jgi:hypothetical protein